MPILRSVKDILRHIDLVLLGLCLAASAMGLVLVYSATRWSAGHYGDFQKQVIFVFLGVAAYIVFTYLDLDLILEKAWVPLFVLSAVFLLLLIPFGYEINGNRNWMYLPGIPVSIQPAEVVKLPFVLILARIIDRSREYGISRPWSVMKMAGFTIFFMGLNTYLSHDFGMSLVYLFIFGVMAFAAGVKLRWFVLALGGFAGAVVLAWSHLPSHIQMRFRILLDHDLDPQGVGYQQGRSLMAIGAGGLKGMGFLQGPVTQSKAAASLPERNTDFIFSVCGEEFGLIGCCALLVVLTLIILRCIQVSRTAKDHMSAYVALGFAGMLMTQTVINVAMCLYVGPVVGLTLPFISYGGSSVLTMYACMGAVSGVKMRTLPSWIKDRSEL